MTGETWQCPLLQLLGQGQVDDLDPFNPVMVQGHQCNLAIELFNRYHGES